MIGLVGAIGTPLSRVTESLGAALAQVGYRRELIHTTTALRTLTGFTDLPAADATPVDEYYEQMIAQGDRLCAETQMKHAMAALAVAAIRGHRKEITGNEETPSDSTAYVIHSLKRPAEVRLLREVYGSQFVLIAAYMPRSSRVSSLAERIAVSRNDGNNDAHRAKAEALVFKDDAESGYGQNVQSTFPMADVFVDASDRAHLDSEIRRVVDLLFGDPFITPRQAEYAMYFAHGASLRSGDLSRQVGAAIVSDLGELLAVGTNEAPRFGGGLYWPTDQNDGRDLKLGYDSSYRRRRQLLGDLLDRLKQERWISEEIAERPTSELVEDTLEGARPFFCATLS